MIGCKWKITRHALSTVIRTLSNKTDSMASIIKIDNSIGTRTITTLTVNIIEDIRIKEETIILPKIISKKNTTTVVMMTKSFLHTIKREEDPAPDQSHLLELISMTISIAFKILRTGIDLTSLKSMSRTDRIITIMTIQGIIKRGAKKNTKMSLTTEIRR